MTLRCARLFVLFAAAVLAQKMGLEQFIGFVKSSIETKQDDRQVAAYLQRVNLTNKLDARTVDDLRTLGAGPKTMVALKELMERSVSLPEAKPLPLKEPPPAPQPEPPPADWERTLAGITERASNYTANLPNFICNQVTRRHIDPRGGEDYRLLDTIQEQLTFFEHHETYKVVMIDGKMQPNMQHDQIGGSVSSGEFGSMLAAIFQPETQTGFQWERMGKLKGRLMYVFTYHVQKQIYEIHHEPSQRTIHVGYHGTIWADVDTKMVMRIKMECEGIPRDFAIQAVSLDLRYDFSPIGEQLYVVPLTMDLRSREERAAVWNEAEFRLYRKYGTESKITFDEGQPKDQPQKPPAKKL